MKEITIKMGLQIYNLLKEKNSDYKKEIKHEAIQSIVHNWKNEIGFYRHNDTFHLNGG